MNKPYFLSADLKFNRPRKNRQDEATIQLQVLHYLRSKGYPCGKIKTKGSFTKHGKFIKDLYQWTGLPDLMVFTPEMIFLEIKAGNNMQTSNQKDFQQFCEKANVKYYIVRCLEDVQKVIS